MELNPTRVVLMMLTPKQQAVANRVKEILQNKPWFRGVCVDDFPTDREIDEDFDGCVAQVEFVTAMWDAPDFMEA